MPVPNKRCIPIEEAIVERIKGGASLSDAPKMEDIDESTFRRWRKCENQAEDGDLTLRDKRCWECANCTLQKKCDAAEMQFKYSCIQTIHKAGETRWQARAWLLERRYPDEYALKRIVNATLEQPKRDGAQLLMEALFAGPEEHEQFNV